MSDDKNLTAEQKARATELIIEKVEKRNVLVASVAAILNRHSRENASNTPDFLLAEVMVTALENFEHQTRAREQWYGVGLSVLGIQRFDDRGRRVGIVPTAFLETYRDDEGAVRRTEE